MTNITQNTQNTRPNNNCNNNNHNNNSINNSTNINSGNSLTSASTANYTTNNSLDTKSMVTIATVHSNNNGNNNSINNLKELKESKRLVGKCLNDKNMEFQSLSTSNTLSPANGPVTVVNDGNGNSDLNNTRSLNSTSHNLHNAILKKQQEKDKGKDKDQEKEKVKVKEKMVGHSLTKKKLHKLTESSQSVLHASTNGVSASNVLNSSNIDFVNQSMVSLDSMTNYTSMTMRTVETTMTISFTNAIVQSRYRNIFLLNVVCIALIINTGLDISLEFEVISDIFWRLIVASLACMSSLTVLIMLNCHLYSLYKYGKSLIETANEPSQVACGPKSNVMCNVISNHTSFFLYIVGCLFGVV